MKYVKQLLHSAEGYISNAKLQFWHTAHPVSVIVHNTERNSDSISTVYGVGRSDTLGYGIHGEYHCLVRMDNKPLQLNSHISVFEEHPVGMVESYYTDKCDFKKGGVKAHGSVPQQERHLVVDATSVTLDICGVNGSVCILSETKPWLFEPMSMYDLLGLVCRRAGMNIFLYEAIYFVVSESVAYQVKLSHDSEAERFFMKMYLDVTRSGQ